MSGFYFAYKRTQNYHKYSKLSVNKQKYLHIWQQSLQKSTQLNIFHCINTAKTATHLLYINKGNNKNYKL